MEAWPELEEGDERILKGVELVTLLSAVGLGVTEATLVEESVSSNSELKEKPLVWLWDNVCSVDFSVQVEEADIKYEGVASSQFWHENTEGLLGVPTILCVVAASGQVVV